MALDSKTCVILVLLDLLAAFDTVDHNILLQRLETRCGVTDGALKWFDSYLSSRTQSVNLNGTKSKPHEMKYVVPQGSVLGPHQYVTYVLPIGDIICKHSLKYHIYADDTQIYITFDPNQDGDLEDAVK